MKKYILVLLLPLQLAAQDALLERFVDSIIGPFNKPDVPGTMVLIAQDGKPLLKKAYGMASLEFGVPLRTDHAFSIGSVGKQFTAVAILQLAQRGKLKLTDDIRKYFPGISTWTRAITIDNLLSHTSGISSTERIDWASFLHENGVSIHSDAFMKYVMGEKLLFEPGTEWSYNNVAYMINSIIIEKVSGQKFGTYMKENVFIPAGMIHTYIPSDLQPLNNLATSYSRGFGGKWRNENTRRNVWEWGNGSGNIISTLDDMLLWDIALREGKVLNTEWLKKAWTPNVLKNGNRINYGYGFALATYDNLEIIHHTGSTYSYSTHSIHIPEKRLYILFEACYNADPTFIPKKILTRFLDIQVPKTSTKPESSVTDYEGSYEMNHLNGRINKQVSDVPIYLKITTSTDSLFAQSHGREKVLLRPAGKDRFMVGRPEDPSLLFTRNNKGDVESVQVIDYIFNSPISNEKYKKVDLPAMPKAVIVSVKPELLKKYAGTYYRAPRDLYFFIENDGKKLFGYELNAAQKFELLPVSNNKFVRKGVEEFSISFKENKDGVMILTTSALRNTDYKKIRD